MKHRYSLAGRTVLVTGSTGGLGQRLGVALRRRGYLMAVSSMAAFVHSPLHAPYSASKAGVLALCNSLRLELRPLGVGVGSVHPTFFDTPMMANAHISPANALVWNNHQDLFWKLTTPEEVVLAIVEGIERRAELVTVPRELKGVGLLAGLLRPLTEPLIFPRRRIQQAVELAQKKMREREL